MQLVTALVLPTYSVGQMSTVQRWIGALGGGEHRGYPPLAVLAGWVAALTGETAGAERWAAFVDGASFDQVPLDGSASFVSARAMLRAVMCADGPEQMMTDARFGVEEEPAWSPWRDNGARLARRGGPDAGDLEAASDFSCSRRRPRSRRQLGNTDTIVLGGSELGLLALDRSEWTEAAERLEPALATIEEPSHARLRRVGALAFAGAARLALHRGDLDDTNRQVARAMRGRATCTYVMPWLAVRVRLHLAKVHAALADHHDRSPPAA